MSGPAQVRSTDAIDALQAALARFQQRVQNALDALDGELHRAADWIEHDRPGHWRKEVHAAENAVHDAKNDLQRCLTFTVGNERPTCREQQAALDQAKVRLDYCREKAESLKTWQRNFRHEQFEYDGRIGQLRRVLELDVPRARGMLTKVLRRLDEYQIERPPETSESLLNGGGVSDADSDRQWSAQSPPETSPTADDSVAEQAPPAAGDAEHRVAPPEPLEER